MILLADYDFYTTKYKGQLSSDLFDNLIPKASFVIKKNVNRPIVEEDSQNEDVEMVACELVDFLKEHDVTLSGKNVQSITMGKVSKTYNNLTKEEIEVEKVKILDKLPLEMIRFL